MNEAAARDHTIAYFVNGEEETTTGHDLSKSTILENAGFTPEELHQE